MKRKKPVYAETSSSDDDTPLASSPAKPSKVNGSAKVKLIESGSEDTSDSEDAPKGKGKKVANGRTRKPPRKKAKEESESSDDDKPFATPQKPKGVAGRKRRVKVEEDSDAEEKEVTSQKKKPADKPRRKKVKEEEASAAETSKPKKGSRGTKESVKDEENDGKSSPVKGKGRKKGKKEEEEAEVYKWWEQGANGDGSLKWTTLEHNGVFFPPPYEPLPNHVKMEYNGMFSFCTIFLSVAELLGQANPSIFHLSQRKLLGFMRHFWRRTMRKTRHSTRTSSMTGKL